MKYCSRGADRAGSPRGENSDRKWTYLDAEDVAELVDLLYVEIDVDLANLARADTIEEECDRLYSLAGL